MCVLVDSRANETNYVVRIRQVLAPLGKQDLVKTLAEALVGIGVDCGTVEGGDFIFDEEGRVTGWRR